jgi:nicotinamidase-related amidase
LPTPVSPLLPAREHERDQKEDVNATVEYRPSDTALVLVDPYNDFLSEGGKVWPRVQDAAESVGTIRHLRELLGAVRRAGIGVFIAPHRRWRPGDFDGWQRLAPPHIGMRDRRAFEAGTWGGEFHPDLAPADGEIVAGEHWAENGFAGTDLDLLLRQHGVGNLIMAGMTAPGCVEGTARSAVEHGYTVTLVTDATAAYTKELMHAAHELTGPFFASAILATDELTAALPPS